jgi:hypothetical protein
MLSGMLSQMDAKEQGNEYESACGFVRKCIIEAHGVYTEIQNWKWRDWGASLLEAER